MPDYLSIKVDAEYEGETIHTTDDQRIENLSIIAGHYQIEPAYLASIILVTLFDVSIEEWIDNSKNEHQSIEQLIVALVCVRAAGMLPRPSEYPDATRVKVVI